MDELNSEISLMIVIVVSHSMVYIECPTYYRLHNEQRGDSNLSKFIQNYLVISDLNELTRKKFFSVLQCGHVIRCLCSVSMTPSFSQLHFYDNLIVVFFMFSSVF